MLGADHHGYVGRLPGAGRRVRRRPGRDARAAHRADGQPAPRRRAAADEQAGRDVVSDRRPRRRRSASTRRATRWRATRSTRPSTSTSTLWSRATSDNPVYYVQYAHARLASILRNADRARASGGAERRTTRRCSTTSARATLLRALAELPARRAAGGRAARAAPGRALPRGPRRDVPQVLRRLPRAAAWATRRSSDMHRARLLLVDATRVVLANGLRLLGVTRPRPDVGRTHVARARGRCPARRGRSPRPALAAAAGRRQRAGPRRCGRRRRSEPPTAS